MLAFEVKLNGKRICVAGMKDLAILNAGVTAAGPLGEKTVKVRPDEDREIFYSVSGLTGRRDPDTDVHVRWRSIEHIHVGDVLQIKVVETDQVDRPRSRKRTSIAKEEETQYLSAGVLNDSPRKPRPS